MFIMAEAGHSVHGLPARPHIQVSNSLPKRLVLGQHGVHYEKEFDIKLTRIQSSQRENRDSMLLYSENMRTLTQRRMQPGLSKEPQSIPSNLQVRARHIPRTRHLPKLSSSPSSPSNKASSLKSLEGGLSRSHSTPLALEGGPGKSYRQKEELRLSLASAADLQEIVNGKSCSSGINDSLVQAWDVTPETKSSVRLPKVNYSVDSTVQKEQLLRKHVKTYKKEEHETLSTGGIKDASSFTEEHNTQQHREEITKQILRSAIVKLKAMEGQPRDPLKVLPKLKRNKRMQIPKGMDSIPEDDAENASEHGSRPPSKNKLLTNHSLQPPSLSRDRSWSMTSSPLDTIIEKDTKHSGLGNSDDSNSEVGETSGKNVCDENVNGSSGHVKLPPILLRHNSDHEKHWRVLGGSDALNSRHLHLRAKQRHKPKHIRYLRGKQY